MSKLKVVDFAEGKFTCDGKTFYVRDSISFNRYRELQRINIEFGFSRTFIELYKALDKAEDYLNKVQLVDAAVELRNAKLGVANLENKDEPALRLCALFINEENEDETVFDEVKMKAKVDCWAKELDVTPFFHLAASSLHGWMPAYKLTTQLILPKEKKD